MRLGGPLFQPPADPALWAAEVTRLGYRAAYCPVDQTADSATIAAFARAAREADLVIAEVGVWNSPLHPDPALRAQAISLCQSRLALADSIGARCCVNISGSRGLPYNKAHPDNFSAETFDLIVETTRLIIDAVNPTRTFFTLEAMPSMYPNTAESYLRLLKAIDRSQFAVHLDPVNWITTLDVFHNNQSFLRDCFAKLGPYIKSCHAKDIALGDGFPLHLQEVQPGLGQLHYPTFLAELNRLPADTPLMLEHLRTPAEYAAASDYIRGVALQQGLSL
jgi:sugar phosphate isomerase/epimerase